MLCRRSAVAGLCGAEGTSLVAMLCLCKNRSHGDRAHIHAFIKEREFVLLVENSERVDKRKEMFVRRVGQPRCLLFLEVEHRLVVPFRDCLGNDSVEFFSPIEDARVVPVDGTKIMHDIAAAHNQNARNKRLS